MTTTEVNQSATLDELLSRWESDGINNVLFELPDMHGSARSKFIPLNKVRGFAEKGLNMYGGALTLDSSSFVVSGTRYNEERNYADQVLVPDLSTAAVVPWMNKTARLICDTYWADGTPLHAAPRHVLRKAAGELDKLGYQTVVGLEYEFYLLDPTTMKPIFDGLHICGAHRRAHAPNRHRHHHRQLRIWTRTIRDQLRAA